jgi:hypothetical protein
VPGGHAQEVVHAHRFQVGRGRLGRVVREELQHLVIDAQLPLGDGEADRRRGEALAQRVQLVPQVGAVRRPPALGDDMAVPDDHHAVQRVDLGLGAVHERGDRRRGDPLRLGGAPRQRAGPVGPRGLADEEDDREGQNATHEGHRFA